MTFNLIVILVSEGTFEVPSASRILFFKFINMLPVLLNLGFIKIYTFGVFLVLAFFWGAFLLWRNIRLTSYKEDDIFDSLFWSILGGILFGRIIYILLNFNDFGFSILKYILINGYPGFSIIGLLAGSLLTLYFYSSIKKIKFKEIIDYFISPLFIVLAFGKLGSFFSGSEIGTKTKFLLSIKYFGVDSLRHLTPLYEAMLFFLGGYIAYKLLFAIRREKYKSPFSFYFFLWLFSLIYFSFDKIKTYKLYLLGWSFNGLISLIVLSITSFYMIFYFKNHIFSFIANIRNSIKTYVKQTSSGVHKKTGKNTS